MEVIDSPVSQPMLYWRIQICFQREQSGGKGGARGSPMHGGRVTVLAKSNGDRRGGNGRGTGHCQPLPLQSRPCYVVWDNTNISGITLYYKTNFRTGRRHVTCQLILKWLSSPLVNCSLTAIFIFCGVCAAMKWRAKRLNFCAWRSNHWSCQTKVSTRAALATEKLRQRWRSRKVSRSERALNHR